MSDKAGKKPEKEQKECIEKSEKEVKHKGKKGQEKPVKEINEEVKSSKSKAKPPSGLGKYFNANTTAGRANVAKATYAGIFLAYLYFRLTKSKPPPSKDIPYNFKSTYHPDDELDCDPNDKKPDKQHVKSSKDNNPDPHPIKPVPKNVDAGSSKNNNSESGKVDARSSKYDDYDSYNRREKTRRTSTANDDDVNKWIVPKYKTDLGFQNEIGDVPKSLPDTKKDYSNEDKEAIRESVALNKLKRRISQNPRFLDP